MRVIFASRREWTGDAMNNFRSAVICLLGFLPCVAHADSLFGKDLAKGQYMPRAFGIGLDIVRVDQDLAIDRLSVVTPPGFPPIPIDDTSAIITRSDIGNDGIKFDAWLLPFFNVFGLYGKFDGDTDVDLRGAMLPLPPDLQQLRITYDGQVYGAGFVLAAGNERWFGSVVATFTDTDLDSGFDSSIKATTLQPRVGLRYGNNNEVWVGGYWIDADESHSGTINVDFGPGVGVVPIGFDVGLSQAEDFSPAIGTHITFGESWELTLEIGGGGDRDTALGNLTYRFE
jgi:hypothetical protein